MPDLSEDRSPDPAGYDRPVPNTLIVLPTYQESPNIERTLRAIRAAAPDAEVLVVDDASPDGTADIAEAVGTELGGVRLLRRDGKKGLGEAYRAGFARAFELDPERIVQMDADGSHDPAVIPDLLRALDDGADCAIGSRYVPGGSTPNWPVHRRVLSRYGNRYTAALLALDITDATSGFRAYRTPILRAIEVTETHSTGYAFMSEVASRLTSAGARITEVPITFVDRTLGRSKMSTRIIVESMARVTWNGLTMRLRRGRRRPGR